MRAIPKFFVRVVLVFSVFVVLVAAPKAYAATPCCNVTSIDRTSGTVTAKETATGRVFKFKVTDAKLLSSLKTGQGIYANFTAKQVSVDGIEPCCAIVRLEPPDGAKNTSNAAPFDPCCNVAAVNANTGRVTVRENSTGRTITLKVSLAPAQLSQTFKVGTAVGFDPVGSARLAVGSSLKLRGAGFEPVDSVVSQIAAH